MTTPDAHHGFQAMSIYLPQGIRKLFRGGRPLNDPLTDGEAPHVKMGPPALTIQKPNPPSTKLPSKPFDPTTPGEDEPVFYRMDFSRFRKGNLL